VATQLRATAHRKPGSDGIPGRVCLDGIRRGFSDVRLGNTNQSTNHHPTQGNYVPGADGDDKSRHKEMASLVGYALAIGIIALVVGSGGVLLFAPRRTA
jgi:hypothetical protein